MKINPKNPQKTTNIPNSSYHENQSKESSKKQVKSVFSRASKELKHKYKLTWNASLESVVVVNKITCDTWQVKHVTHPILYNYKIKKFLNYSSLESDGGLRCYELLARIS